jgi:hypothetical protein
MDLVKSWEACLLIGNCSLHGTSELIRQLVYLLLICLIVRRELDWRALTLELLK